MRIILASEHKTKEMFRALRTHPTLGKHWFRCSHFAPKSSYDAEADVLYLSFRKPSQAGDSEISDDGIIVRYQGGEVVGVTILNASERVAKSTT